MRLSAITTVACLLASGTAFTIPAEVRSTTDMTEAPVEKRQLITALVTAALTSAATEAGTLIVEEAAKAAVAAINNIVTDFTTVGNIFLFPVSLREITDESIGSSKVHTSNHPYYV